VRTPDRAGDGDTPVAPQALTELLDALCDAARVSFAAESVSIARVDEDEGRLVYVAAIGRGASEVVGMRLPLGQGLAGYAAAAAEAIAVDDVTRDPRFARDVAERIGYVPRSILVAPIRRGDEVLGVLSILDRTEPAGSVALDRAGRFARAAAGTLELLAAFEAAAAGSVSAPAGPDPDAALAAAVAEVHALGPVERDAAARLLEDFLAYAARRRR
jgi:GAF domain-containing protein